MKKQTNLSKSEAIKVALPKITSVYPSELEEIKEWGANYRDGKWFVEPRFGPDVFGGGASAEVDDVSGKVIRVYFSE